MSVPFGTYFLKGRCILAEADESRRIEILNAAGSVFIEKGFEAATTAEIARRAKISKRDLYAMFGSKQGLLEALISTHSRMAIPASLGVPRDREAFLGTLRSFGRIFLREFLESSRVALYRLAIAESPRSTKLAEALHESGALPVITSAQAFMRHAVERGIVPLCDAELVMATYFDVLIGPWQLRQLLGTHPKLDEASLAQQAERAVEVVRRLIEAGPAKA